MEHQSADKVFAHPVGKILQRLRDRNACVDRLRGALLETARECLYSGSQTVVLFPVEIAISSRLDRIVVEFLSLLLELRDLLLERADLCFPGGKLLAQVLDGRRVIADSLQFPGEFLLVQACTPYA